MDLDIVVKVYDYKIIRFMYFKGEEMFNFKKYCGKELFVFINCEEDFIKFLKILEFYKNLFIWRYGIVEDVILSFGSVNDGIVKVINILNVKILKNRLKKRFSEEEKDRFYNELIKIEEI